MWAVAQNVDIISMSFGFPRWHNAIREAIQATPNRVLMFAAASTGKNAYVPTFPANEPSVISIWAADGMGSQPKTNSKAGRFATLGVAVKSAWPERPENPAMFEARKSGTSYATPIAVGIAACVLEFARQNDMAKVFYDELTSHRGMTKVFQFMEVESKGLHLICPWKLFHKSMRRTSILDTLVTLVN